MGFRERMKVEESNAEFMVRKELQRQHIGGWVTDDDAQLILLVTTPDLWFPEKRVAVYLDGDKVHGSIHTQDRDEKITETLEKRGVKVLRFRYHAPLTKQKLAEFMNELKVKLNG